MNLALTFVDFDNPFGFLFCSNKIKCKGCTGRHATLKITTMHHRVGYKFLMVPRPPVSAPVRQKRKPSVWSRAPLTLSSFTHLENLNNR